MNCLAFCRSLLILTTTLLQLAFIVNNFLALSNLFFFLGFGSRHVVLERASSSPTFLSCSGAWHCLQALAKEFLARQLAPALGLWLVINQLDHEALPCALSSCCPGLRFTPIKIREHHRTQTSVFTVRCTDAFV